VAVDRLLDAVAQRWTRHDSRDAKTSSASAPSTLDRQDRGEQLAELAVARRQHVVRRLLDEHRAADLLAHVDRVRRREHDRRASRA
jgi:hypothetical protein